jgi:transcriptional regulator with PAS, ATPase and Fis domain
LFGHVKGAFSGAIADKKGKFEAADGGTIFLDEISLATHSLQTKLLRVIESRKFEPVGSNDTREVDVRIILATNGNLEEMVREGDFREDLYYRINVMDVYLPPLRRRRDDIAALTEHFIQKYKARSPRPVEGITKKALEVLQSYDWPGNVRELENVIQKAVVFCQGAYIEQQDVQVDPVSDEQNSPFHSGEVLPLKEGMKKAEKRFILQALEACDHNKKRAASVLDINRTTFYNKLHQHGILD